MMILLISLFNPLCFAGPQTATITNVSGEVHLLKSPSKKADGDGIHVLYQNHYYRYLDAKVGEKVELDEVVQTTAGSKARMIFENGDQINVGELTSYQLETPVKGRSSPQLNLIFGKVRSVVDKEGPRNHLTIRNKTAVMGVRGTDFLVKDSTNGTELQVFRGKVEIKTVDQPTPPKMISRGDAAIASSTEKKALVTVHALTQEDLHETHENLFVSNTNAAATTPEVAALEKKAVESSLKDLKAENPEVFNSLKGKSISSAQAVNAEVLASLFDQAKRRDPNDSSALSKPSGEDVEKLIEDQYNRMKR